MINTTKEIKEQYNLFDHQVEGVKFAIKSRKCILAHEMGLGKSRIAIVASGISSNASILIICPASLKINWEREIKMIYPDDNVCVIQSGPERLIEWNHFSWIVVNYDMLEKYNDQLLHMISKKEIETVILDEAHYIKGSDTIRAKTALKICEKADRVYMLTGTPVMNRPVELFNLLKGIGHPLGKLKTVFVKRYCGGQMKTLVQDITTGKRFFVDPSKSYPFRAQKTKYKVFTFMDDSGATRLDELREYTKDVMLRRKKEDVLDLPDKIIGTQICELDKEWQSRYDTAWDVYIDWIEKHPDAERDIENIKGAQQLIEIGKLKQVCSLAKVSRIVADIENAIEQGEKVIVFSQYTKTIGQIANSIGNRAVTLTGSDDQNSRQIAVDTFQNDPNCKVFIANIKAGGVGITLTAASIVIFADMDWSPEIHNQCMDRAHRIGQKGTVNVYYYVIKDTIEEKIVDLLSEKKEIISKLVKAK